MTVVEPRRPSVSAAQSIPTYYRMLLRGQLTKGRMVGLGVLGGISLLLAIVSRTSAEQADLDKQKKAKGREAAEVEQKIKNLYM